jgi:GNAT superfamily N-acetyltransferase
MINFKLLDRYRIDDLRDKYLDSLPYPQELFLELFCRNANAYLIELNNSKVGYFLSSDHMLFEIYIEDSFLPFGDGILDEIIDQFNISKAYVKSFDFLALSLCSSRTKSIQAVGCLFRDYIGYEVQLNEPIYSMLATENDIQMIGNHLEGIFDNLEEALDAIKADGMKIYEIAGKMVGYGIFQRTIPGRKSFDIGMYVVPEFRRLGFATYIINDLRLLCENNNWQPTLGCEIGNTGSRRTLEKAGFRTKHRLIEFKF